MPDLLTPNAVDTEAYDLAVIGAGLLASLQQLLQPKTAHGLLSLATAPSVVLASMSDASRPKQ